IDEQIPPGHPLVVVGKRIEKIFGGKYVCVIGVYPKSGTVYTPATLAKVKRITEAVEKIPGVRPGSVVSLMAPRVKDIRSTEEALEVAPLAPSIPQTDADMSKFRDAVKRNHVITSLLVSDDGRAAAVLVDFQDFEKAGGAPGLFPKLESILGPERDANT